MKSLAEKKPKISPSTIIGHFHAIGWVHRIAGVSPPTSTPMAIEALEAAKRMNARPTNRKTALTPAEFYTILKNFPGPTASLGQLRLAACVICGFLAFLRADEIINLKREHLSFCARLRRPAHNQSKKRPNEARPRDKDRGDRWTFCPMEILRRYFVESRCNRSATDSDAPLFPALRNLNGTARPLKKPMTYDCLRKEFKSAIRGMGLQSDLFGTHSMNETGRRHGRCSGESTGKGTPKSRSLEIGGRQRSIHRTDPRGTVASLSGDFKKFGIRKSFVWVFL